MAPLFIMSHAKRPSFAEPKLGSQQVMWHDTGKVGGVDFKAAARRRTTFMGCSMSIGGKMGRCRHKEEDRQAYSTSEGFADARHPGAKLVSFVQLCRLRPGSYRHLSSHVGSQVYTRICILAPSFLQVTVSLNMLALGKNRR